MLSRFARSLRNWPFAVFVCSAFAQDPRTVMVPMRDGIRLATDIYGADDAVRKPVLLLRTPYDKKGGSSTARKYAGAGYVAVVQDARGAFASEGRYFHHNNDDQDGYDTIEWLSRQPWSNGKTGMWGGSHPGAVQWLAAGDRPPGLTVIAPAATSASLYYTAYVGGALRLALIGGAGPLITKPPVGKAVPADLIRFYRTLPLVDLDTAIGWEMPWLRSMVSHPWLDGFWARQHASERVKGLDLPAQHIVGYYDFLGKETVASFQRMRAQANQQLILGPWDHGTVGKRAVAGFDFGEAAQVNVVEENLRWFDRFLKPGGPGEYPRVRYFVLGLNEWRTASDWPPPGASVTSLYFRSDRSLAAAGDERPVSFVSDPGDPVPVEPSGFAEMPRSSMFRPVERSAIEKRADVVTYTAAAQTAPLLVAGSPRAELWVSVDAEDADFAVKLVDVWPDGKAYPVAEGVLRLTHREGDSRPAPVTAGQVYRIEVELGHTAFSLSPGHALRVEIAGSYFPAYDFNSHTGEGPWAKTAKKATQTIHRGRVIVPVRRD